MNKKITFRGMEQSTAIENFIHEQLAKVEEFLSNENTPIHIDVVLKPSKIRAHHDVEIRVKSPNYDRISNYEGTDFYHTITRVIDVMYKELLEDKKKRVDSRKWTGRKDDFKKER